MAKTNSESNFQLNIGLPSIILIFVVMCLVSFSLLSLVSANADCKLSRKVLNRTSNYYECSNAFYRELHTILSECEAFYTLHPQREEYEAFTCTLPTTFRYQLDTNQIFEVQLCYLFPEDSPTYYYSILSKKIVTLEEHEYDMSLDVLQWE